MNKPLRVSLPPSPRKGIIAMIAPDIVGPAGVLDQALGQASPDLMRSLLQTMVNALLSADADAVCGAEYGQASPERRASATATATGTWTPGSGPLTWLFPGCVPARTSPTGCSSAANGPSPR